jgi:hypothetical protein
MSFFRIVLAGLFACAAPAAAQTKETGVGPVFHEALLACASPTDGSLDMWSACAGVRFGVLEAYLEAASLCLGTAAKEDCAKAKTLEELSQGVLKRLSKR